MSQVSPGWYRDPSGRFAQRYHDGSRWTEHVADAQGNRDTDVPVGQAGPASHGDPGRHYGHGGQRSSDPYRQQSAGAERDYGGQSAGEKGYGQSGAGADRDRGGQSAGDQGYGQAASGWDGGYDQWAAREQGWGEEQAGPSRGYRERRGETGWDEGAGASGWQGQGGGPASRNRWPQARGASQQGGDGWASTPTGGEAPGGAWPVAGQRPGPARFDTGRHYGQPTGYGQPATYGQPGYRGAPPVSSGAFTPTIGLVVAAVGAILLLLSLFGLNFIELSFPGVSRSVSLGDIAGDFGDGAPAALATYADFGRFLAVLVAVLALLAAARVVPQLRDITALPVIMAVACGAFALWHVLAMLAGADEGVDVSPTLGAILGLFGYVALAAGPFLRQPLQAQR